MDLTWFTSAEETTKRSLDLDKFNIKYSRATEDEISKYLALRKFMGRDIYEAIIPFKHKKYVKLKEFQAFDDKYLKLGGSVYLEGYWTDERYFADIANIIRKEFTLIRELSPTNKNISELIKQTESVSIHIRRGDYITNSNFSPIFNICNHKYYSRAISEIVNRSIDPCFFIFSDDIEWARQNIRTGHETVYVSGAGGDLPHEELVLMSMCKHHIIANSTFSWWGAWLNPNEGKIVVAPEKWVNSAEYQSGDLVPPTWLKIAIE